MPANLPPKYYEAERRYKTARTTEEKIEALQAMLAIMPHHKGTDKLHADLRRKIAKLSEEAERKTSTSKSSYYIRKEGAGQVVLLGLPNSGKSRLLCATTDALTEIADYPFTTHEPVIGMMKFENVQIQMVDMPAVSGHDSRVWINNISRNADLVAIVVDLGIASIDAAQSVLNELEGMGIVPSQGEMPQADYGIRPRKMVIVGNKCDTEAGDSGYETLARQYGHTFPLIKISAEKGLHLDEFKKQVFTALDVIRVHTKNPGQKTSLNDPMIMRKGSTVKEAAEAVHKDFRQKLKYALVWGSGKFDGQRVSQNHILQDNDIIELHI